MQDLNKEQVYLQWLFEKNQRIIQLQAQVQQLMQDKADLEAKLADKEGK